jgi:alpha-ketoglutarate-dependent taurine dioxygenase
MTPTVKRLDATLGAIVTDIDLAAMDEATWRRVEDAFHQYALLVFPALSLSEQAQIAFARRFGAMELLRDDPEAEAVMISNQVADGSLTGPDDHLYKVLRGNEGWHTDSSYMPLAAKASVLSAQVVPPAGGETEWADMRDAYDKLDQALKDRIDGLSAYHSIYQSQAKIGYAIETGAGYGFHTKGAPLRPLVKLHPVTGRKALFIGRHAYRIPGMADGEAQALLDELTDFACQPPRTYAHSWQPGDAIIWDNRCVLHRARPYDTNETRIMRHTRIAGEPESELAETGRDERAREFEPSASNR